MTDRIGKPMSQRQLRVGEMIKQSLSMIFIRNEAKVPNLETNMITVTEVKMSQDLKIAKAYVLPLGGKDADEVIEKLKEYSFLIRKILSKKVIVKFLPKLLFRKDESFEYAEKIENLIKQTQNSHITLINRTKDKAEKVAGKFNLEVKDINELSNEIYKADVLVVATGSNESTVTKDIIKNTQPLLILDLSIPRNVSKDIIALDNVQLVHLDDLSKITDKTFELREKEIPKALNIIEDVIVEFQQWLESRKFAPTIRALKTKLNELKNLELENLKKKNTNFNSKHAELISDKMIQKITNHFAYHLTNENGSASRSEELIKKVFNLEKTL